MRLFLLLLVALLPVTAMAQTKKPPQRTCRILYLLAPSGAPTKLHLFDGKASQEVELPRMNFSKTYRLPPGDLQLRFLTAPPLTPEEIPAGAPAFRMPAAITDAYFLVTTDRSNKVAPVRVQVVNADAAKFKKGQIMWFNLTPALVGGKVGSADLRLKPRARAVTGAPTRAKESYPVNLSYKVEGDDRTFPLCETSWLHDPRSRKVAFVFTEKGRRTPRVLAFSDYRPPVKKDE